MGKKPAAVIKEILRLSRTKPRNNMDVFDETAKALTSCGAPVKEEHRIQTFGLQKLGLTSCQWYNTCMRVGLRASFMSTVSAPPIPRSSAEIGSPAIPLSYVLMGGGGSYISGGPLNHL